MVQERRDIDASIEKARSRRSRRNGFLGRIAAISTGDIVFLIIACVVVGFLLAMFNVDPRGFWAEAARRVGEFFAMFRESFADVLNYMLYGAIIVVPLWVLLRVIKAMR